MLFRSVAARRDGTPRSHYPPPDRPDLRCGAESGGRTTQATHCAGSHTPPPRERLAVRVIGDPATVEQLALAVQAAADTTPGWRVLRSDLADSRAAGLVRLYMDLEIADD